MEVHLSYVPTAIFVFYFFSYYLIPTFMATPLGFIIQRRTINVVECDISNLNEDNMSYTVRLGSGLQQKCTE